MHIGLFDSGVGGLTVLNEIRKTLPEARFTYLGDTARLPYGNKAPSTLKTYTQENMDFLDSHKVDVIVIACHSASSVALDINQSPKGTPVLNVIAPSCLEALQVSQNKNIGVLATKATTRSQVYVKTLEKMDTSVKVHSSAAPLLVPLVEESYIQDPVTLTLLERYLAPLLKAHVDSLILGCTHYPLLKDPIRQVCGPGVQLIDPARSVAERLSPLLKKSKDRHPLVKIYLTDHAPHFLEHAEQILQQQVPIEAITPKL